MELESTFRAELDITHQRVNKLREQLARQFPDYVKLSSPRPLSVADTQALLTDEEALLVYLVEGTEGGSQVLNDAAYIWLVRSDVLKMIKIDINRQALRGLR